MTPLLQAGASCALLVLSTQVAPTDTGWLEVSELLLGAKDSDCDRVEIPLPPGVSLGSELRVVERLGDGIKRKQDPSGVQRLPRSLQGHAVAIVHLPDLRAGDQATLRWERTWERAAALEWVPPVGLGHGELTAEANIAPAGRLQKGKRGFWVSEVVAGDSATVSAPGLQGPWTNPDASRLPPSREPEITRQLVLEVPKGDPQLSLYPGGGSTVQTRLQLAFEAEGRDRSWMVPLGAGSSPPQVVVQPSESAASWEVRGQDLLLTIAASEGPARLAVSWTTPDAPTYGEAQPGETLEVEVRDGLVVTDRNGAWFLAAVGGRPVIPARSALVRGLDRRFRNMAIPEPGLPTSLRGIPASWELAAQIPEALRERIEVVDPGLDPLWVRKLIKARKTGGVTPTEAGLMVWLYANQAELAARWALVRAAPQGPGGDASPSGYEHLLVRIEHAGEQRWLDPVCAECAPFEIRPELTGADALGWEIERGPDQVEGKWIAVFGPDWVRWELSGPAALELRRWLSPLPVDERYRAIAERMAGPGAELVQVDGLDEPGATIALATRGGHGVRADPMSLSVPNADGSWADWVGVRELYRPDGLGPTGELQTDGLHWHGALGGDGVLVERLELKRRGIKASEAAALIEARAPAEPELEPEPAPEPEPTDPG